MKQVLEHQATYRAGKTSVLSIQLLVFLKNWLLIKHIQQSDKALGAHLKAQGVKLSA